MRSKPYLKYENSPASREKQITQCQIHVCDVLGQFQNCKRNHVKPQLSAVLTLEKREMENSTNPDFIATEEISSQKEKNVVILLGCVFLGQAADYRLRSYRLL